MRGTMMILMIWKSFRNFKGHSSVSTWIYRITLNTCITNLRKKKNYDYVPLKQDIDILDDCEHDECMKHLYQLIHQLDNVDKMYIMLWLDEKSYDEIAEIVGVGRNNVAIRIHRIKEKLKKMSNR
jgi:RNA polymerase sigma-70 factor (ECF subfamily)